MTFSTSTKGYYPVYLFREDFTGLYFGLNQGVTDIRQKYPKPKVALKTKAADYRAQIGGLPSGFTETEIDLRPSSSSNLSAYYEAGNICAKFYDPKALPSEEALTSDLRNLLQIYSLLSYNETVPVGAAPDDEEETNLFVKDLRKFRQHKRVERNARLAKEAKRIHGYTCKLCGFDFEQGYGEIGREYIEAHHLTPISKLKGEKLLLNPTTDFTVLCANCHRMIHRCEFPHDIEGFRKKYLKEEGQGSQHLRGRSISRTSPNEFIAEAVDSEDELRVVGVGFEFLPEPGDVDIDGAGRGHRVVAPDFVQQFVA